MERPYISQELRRQVASRAAHLCEYCLIHEKDTAFGCAVDHIISLKHGGATDADNLAYACVFCNPSGSPVAYGGRPAYSAGLTASKAAILALLFGKPKNSLGFIIRAAITGQSIFNCKMRSCNR